MLTEAELLGIMESKGFVCVRPERDGDELDRSFELVAEASRKYIEDYTHCTIREAGFASRYVVDRVIRDLTVAEFIGLKARRKK
jgi:hypothetical protein